jgi:hypothetical protein
MKIIKLSSPILTGILVALLIHGIARICLFSVSMGGYDYLWFLLLLGLPSPLALGYVAGLIEIWSNRRYRVLSAFWLALLGMLVAIPSSLMIITLLFSRRIDESRLFFYDVFYIGLEIMIGILVQGIFVLLRLVLPHILIHD